MLWANVPVRVVLPGVSAFSLLPQLGENVQLTNTLVPPFRSAFPNLERPMKIEIVVDPVNLPGQSLVSRVAPAPAPATEGPTDAPRYAKDLLSRGGET